MEKSAGVVALRRQLEKAIATEVSFLEGVGLT